LGRQSSAYEAERQRQQAAAGGLLNTQMSATTSIPALIAAGAGANQAGLAAGQYQDNAEMEKLRQYTSILSGLSQPFAMQDSQSKSVEKTGGLGSVIGSIAQLGGAIAAPFTGGMSSILGGMASGASPIMGGALAASGLGSGALPSWLGK